MRRHRASGQLNDVVLNYFDSLPDWSFESLFGRSIRQSCPVASTSQITVDLSHEDEKTGYTLEPKTPVKRVHWDTTASYNVNAGAQLVD